MRNLKVRYKMLIGFGIIMILLILMNGFSLYNLRSTSNMVGELYDGPHMNTMAAVALMKDFYQMDTGVKGLILGLDTDSSSYDAARKSADQNMKEIAAQGILTTEKQNTIQSALSQLDSSYNKIKGTAGTSGQQALAELQQVYEPLMKTALVAVQDAASGANQEAQLFRENTIERTNVNILLQDIMFVVIVVCSVIVALRMAADISLPLRRLGREMDKIAEGNFNVELNNPWNDEMGIFTRQLSDTINRIKEYINDISYVLGEISGGNIAIEVTREYVGDFGAIRESLNQIIQSLNGTMDQIRKCCDEVKTGASSLADSSQSLAQGSAQQSDAVEGFQVNLNTVASLTAGDGENAGKVNVLSIKTNEAVNHSDEQMSEMIRAMDGINASSAEIAKIIKIIEDIAFQTNILALNAAVEAARAGTAGKGFAVVADEVRNLASKSAEASKNTSQLIQASMSAVEKGTLIADAAAESLREVGANVRSMSGYLEAIDKSTARQAEAFDQMLHLSEEITQVVHTNSSAAEENSAASEELSAQARLLDQLVNRFKLSNS